MEKALNLLELLGKRLSYEVPLVSNLIKVN
jgi:hypothetical protein